MKKYPNVKLVHNRRDESKLIEVRIYFPTKRERVYISTGVQTDYWNSDGKTLSFKDPKFYTKNPVIISELAEANRYLGLMINKGMTMDKKSFDIVRKKRVALDLSENFVMFCRKQVELEPIEESTKRHQRYSIGLFADVKTPIYMEDIDYQFAEDFDRVLRKKYTNLNTISRHHKTLRKYVGLALAKGFLSAEKVSNFQHFSIASQTSGKNPLTEEELQAFEDFKFKEGDTRKIYIDAFLFCCYCGLRISDVLSLTPEHITDYKGEMRLSKEMIKLRHLKKKVNLPLSKLFAGRPAEILRPYLDATEPKERIFARSHQKTNEILKVVGNEIGIEKISFHVSRHTFLTNLAAKTGDVFKVMEYGGIATIDTAQGYIKLAASRLDKSLDEVKW